MTLEWRGRTLVITWLPVASMGRLAACAPQTAAETEVLAALLAGARVRVERDALEYRRYRRTAPLASIRNAPVWSGACGRWVFVLLGQVAGKVWATKKSPPSPGRRF